MAEIIELKPGLDSESIRTAREVADQEDFSNVIIQASLDGIITYDREARYTAWNPSMERISGVKAKDVLGKSCFEVFPFLKEAGMESPILKSLQGEVVRSLPISFFVPETGAQGFTEQQNFPLYNEQGVITGGLAIVRDVTEMKQRFDAITAKNRQLEARVRELEKQLAITEKSRE